MCISNLSTLVSRLPAYGNGRVVLATFWHKYGSQVLTARGRCVFLLCSPSMAKMRALLMRQYKGLCRLFHCCAKSLVDCKEATSSNITSAWGLLLPCCLASSSNASLRRSPRALFRHARMTGRENSTLLHDKFLELQSGTVVKSRCAEAIGTYHVPCVSRVKQPSLCQYRCKCQN